MSRVCVAVAIATAAKETTPSGVVSVIPLAKIHRVQPHLVQSLEKQAGDGVCTGVGSCTMEASGRTHATYHAEMGCVLCTASISVLMMSVLRRPCPMSPSLGFSDRPSRQHTSCPQRRGSHSTCRCHSDSITYDRCSCRSDDDVRESDRGQDQETGNNDREQQRGRGRRKIDIVSCLVMSCDVDAMRCHVMPLRLCFMPFMPSHVLCSECRRCCRSSVYAA